MRLRQQLRTRLAGDLHRLATQCDRYVMDVDVSTYPATYRAMFRTLTGTWSVAPVDGGTRATIRFDAQLRRIPGLPALVSRLAVRGGADLEAILDSYQHTAEQRAG